MPQDRFKQSTRLQKEPMFLGGEIEEGFLEEEAFYELFSPRARTKDMYPFGKWLWI